MKRIVSAFPDSLALIASLITAAIAWLDSGAGTIPSAAAKSTHALKLTFWLIAVLVINPYCVS
ncbi:MAG: hypothetical protein PHT63_06665 [Bacteroidales bacterium]|nr:hypothetical protein [Bacteroidales bacterium]